MARPTFFFWYTAMPGASSEKSYNLYSMSTLLISCCPFRMQKQHKLCSSLYKTLRATFIIFVATQPPWYSHRCKHYMMLKTNSWLFWSRGRLHQWISFLSWKIFQTSGARGEHERDRFAESKETYTTHAIKPVASNCLNTPIRAISWFRCSVWSSSCEPFWLRRVSVWMVVAACGLLCEVGCVEGTVWVGEL